MDKHRNWLFRLAVLPAAASAGLYVVHYLIFRDAHHIFIFLLEDIAFVPVHVLLITLIIDRWMNEREKEATVRKLDMVVGVFFAEMLLAVTHLSDELAQRPALDSLPKADYNHLSHDLKRAYRRFIIEWLRHMHHLKRDYPYIFSLSVRMNPFDPAASVIITADEAGL